MIRSVGLGVAEREAVLVADPLLVDLGVVAGEATHHLAATVVDADRGTAGVVLGDTRRGDEVEGARAEAVVGRGQRADRADLDRVAGEVALEGLALVDRDLLHRAALGEGDERVTGDLLGEAGAARAEDAALAVEQDLGGDVDRLGEGALEPPRSAKRLSPRPLLMAWFCRGHSPPLSQTGQSSGWLMSRNSMMPCCALSATSLVAWVLTTMPSATGSVQEACGLGKRRPLPASGMSTRHWRHAPTGVEQRVVAEARDLHADLLGGADDQGVLGDADLDAVDGQGDEVGVASPALWSSSCVGSHGCEGGRGGRVERAAAVAQVCEVLVAEVLDRARDRAGRTVAEGAERAAQDVVALVEQQVEVVLARPAPSPGGPASASATTCPHGTGCTCRRTRACRTRSTAAPRGPRRWSRRRAAGRGCRAWSRPRRPTRSRGVRRGARASAAGCSTRRASRTSARGPRACRRRGRSAGAA